MIPSHETVLVYADHWHRQTDTAIQTSVAASHHLDVGQVEVRRTDAQNLLNRVLHANGHVIPITQWRPRAQPVPDGARRRVRPPRWLGRMTNPG